MKLINTISYQQTKNDKPELNQPKQVENQNL